MGWTNTQAETITGLAFTYLASTVLFSVGSALTLDASATFSSATDIQLTGGAGVVFDGDTRLARDADGALAVDGVAQLPATAANHNDLAIAGTTTTSATYVTVAGVSFNFTKKALHTALRFDFGSTFYSDAINTVVRFGIGVTGQPDSDIANRFINDANKHEFLGGTLINYDGLAPGTYTIELLWKRISGAGVLTQSGTSYNSLTVQEC